MSKSIYDEVLEILLDSFKDPQDEDNDCFMFNFKQIIKIEKALLQAQKQEKLLELYRKLDDCIVAPTGHHVCRYEDDEKYARIRKQIKEIENEI